VIAGGFERDHVAGRITTTNKTPKNTKKPGCPRSFRCMPHQEGEKEPSSFNRPTHCGASSVGIRGEGRRGVGVSTEPSERPGRIRGGRRIRVRDRSRLRHRHSRSVRSASVVAVRDRHRRPLNSTSRLRLDADRRRRSTRGIPGGRRRGGCRAHLSGFIWGDVSRPVIVSASELRESGVAGHISLGPHPRLSALAFGGSVVVDIARSGGVRRAGWLFGWWPSLWSTSVPQTTRSCWRRRGRDRRCVERPGACPVARFGDRSSGGV